MSTHQITFITFLLLSFGVFGFTFQKLYAYFKLTRKAPRFDKIGQRITTTLQVAFGQSKILKKPIAGTFHAIMFWGFIVITIGTIEMIIDGVSGTTRILSSLGVFYDIITVSGEFLAILIILGCLIFLCRRYITKPKRFKAPEMKPGSKLDATIILIMIFLLMVSLLGMNMGYIGLHLNEYVGAFPVSRFLMYKMGLAASLEGNSKMIEMVNWWTHISLIFIFLNILPYSKHFHIMLSVPNVFFTRLEPPAKLNNMESITKEVKLMMEPDTASSAPAEGAEVPRFGVKDAEG